MSITLIADSGATKAEWCLLNNGKKEILFTRGISPYFLNTDQIAELVAEELAIKIKGNTIEHIFYYGTGCASIENARHVQTALLKVFPQARVAIDTDLMAAARALCGNEKGLVTNFGTGSFCCFYDGKKITKQSPGIGYILGDEGSGAYLGRKVIQYYLYQIFDEDLKDRFESRYKSDRAEILDNVYKKPFPNRYMASYTLFLAENRGHYMIENIIEDGLNDFFFQHLCKYAEVWRYPVNFVGSVAYGFKDVLKELCNSYEFELGKVLKNPMEGLIEYHRES